MVADRYASMETAWELKYCNSSDVFYKTITSLVIVGYEIVLANSALISNARSRWFPPNIRAIQAKTNLLKRPISIVTG